MAYFEENSRPMHDLEAMVDAVGLRNVLYALSHICSAKADHVETNWQDASTARVWNNHARALHTFATRRPDCPLDR